MGDAGGTAGFTAASVPEVLLELDHEARVTAVGHAAAGRLAGPPAPGTGPAALLMLVHPEERDRVYALSEALGAAPPGAEAALTVRLRGPDGAWRQEALSARRHTGGAVVAVSPWPSLSGLSPTDLARMRAPAATVGRDGRFDAVNGALCQLLGYEETELRTRSPAALSHPDDADLSAALDRLVAAGADHAVAVVRWLRAEGTAVSVVEHRTSAGGGDPVVIRLEAVAPAAAASGEPPNGLAAALVEALPTILVAVDAGGTIIRANRAAAATAGVEAAELVGRPVDDVFPSATVEPPLQELVSRAVDRGAPASAETRLADGRTSPLILEWTASPLLPPVGRATAVLAGVDVTERQATLAAVSFKALHDPLTRLPNRALLQERLSHALSRLGRTESELAVLFVDLNHFKDVNDRFGHDAGDRLLAALAERFRAAVRPSDTVARIGGDEFVVLCEDLPDGTSALAIVDRLVDAIEQPFPVDDTEVSVSAAVGIAFARHAGADADALIRQADAAMYDAKRRSGAPLRSPSVAGGRTGSERTSLDEASLRAAVEAGGVVVLYQPQISLPGGELTGVEALVRIVDPERGMLTPASFLAVAEQTGLIVPIGAAVIRDVCRRLPEWRAVAPDLRVTVNLSAGELAAPGAVTDLAAALRAAGVDPAAIVVDVREDVLLAGGSGAHEALRALKEVGVQLSVDDAGLRFTTSGDLLTLGVDEVKVAGGHVQGIGQDPDGEPVVASIVRLARTLDLRTVAEGVETVDQLAGLRTLGCDAGQGYLFAPPQPADVIDRLVGPGLRWPTDSGPGADTSPT